MSNQLQKNRISCDTIVLKEPTHKSKGTIVVNDEDDNIVFQEPVLECDDNDHIPYSIKYLPISDYWPMMGYQQYHYPQPFQRIHQYYNQPIQRQSISYNNQKQYSLHHLPSSHSLLGKLLPYTYTAWTSPLLYNYGR